MAMENVGPGKCGTWKNDRPNYRAENAQSRANGLVFHFSALRFGPSSVIFQVLHFPARRFAPPPSIPHEGEGDFSSFASVPSYVG